jgi:hypothetical protein
MGAPSPSARLLLAVLAAWLCALGAPAWGAQRDCKAPPGTSAIDQYCETIPAAGGDRGSSDRSGSRAESSLSPRTAQALRQAGPNGAGILALPAGAPRGGSAVATPPKPAPVSESPLNAVGSAIESGASVDSRFLWVLIGLGIAFVAAAWLRYRRPGEG